MSTRLSSSAPEPGGTIYFENNERALAEFLGILHRYELQPRLARVQTLRELTAAAEGPLQAELSDRLAALRRAVEGTRSTDEPEDE